MQQTSKYAKSLQFLSFFIVYGPFFFFNSFELTDPNRKQANIIRNIRINNSSHQEYNSRPTLQACDNGETAKSRWLGKKQRA